MFQSIYLAQERFGVILLSLRGDILQGGEERGLFLCGGWRGNGLDVLANEFSTLSHCFVAWRLSKFGILEDTGQKPCQILPLYVACGSVCCPKVQHRYPIGSVGPVGGSKTACKYTLLIGLIGKTRRRLGCSVFQLRRRWKFAPVHIYQGF